MALQSDESYLYWTPAPAKWDATPAHVKQSLFVRYDGAALAQDQEQSAVSSDVLTQDQEQSAVSSDVLTQDQEQSAVSSDALAHDQEQSAVSSDALALVVKSNNC